MPEPGSDKILLVLVGLPARGKSYVAHKVTAFMRWKGVSCRSFNVGALRRKAVHEKQTADFFSSANEAAKATREAVALEVLHGALDWLNTSGNIAILDATNTTRDRRRKVQQSVLDYYHGDATKVPYIVFVECICTNPTVLASNMLQKVTNSPDYRDMPVEAALADLKARIAEYEKVYETIDDELEDAISPLGSVSYVKTIDLQSKIVCRNIWGANALLIVSFLMVIHVGARPIYLVRAGQCTDDVVRAMLKRNIVESGASTEVSRATSMGYADKSDAPAESKHMYQGLASLSVSMASTALSAGLTLNDNGKRFAKMVADFVLRRTAGGASQRSLGVDGTKPPSLATRSGSDHSDGSALRIMTAKGKTVTHVSLLDSMRPVKLKGFDPTAAVTPVAGKADTSPAAAFEPGAPGATPLAPRGGADGFVVKKLRKVGETPRLTAVDTAEATAVPSLELSAPPSAAPLPRESSEDFVDDEDAEEGIVASAPCLAQVGHYQRDGAPALAANVDDLIIFDAPPAIYTSTLPRTIEMTEPFSTPSMQFSALNPMETGICLGIPLQYLKSQFPDEYSRWQAAPDRARYRITGGESLMDVVARLTPVVIELERQRRPVVVISHLSTLQVLLAYFKGVPLEDCVNLDFPMNTVIEFSPHQYGWLERRYMFTKVESADVITSSTTW